MAKQRWCLNKKTGNVKPWNPSMETVTEVVECDMNGVPLDLLEMANKYRDMKLPGGKSAVDVVLERENVRPILEDMSEEIEEAEEAEEAEEVEETGEVSKSEQLIRDLMETHTKTELIRQARELGIKASKTDERANKRYFAERIVEKSR